MSNRIKAADLFQIAPQASKKISHGAAVKITRLRYCSKIHVAGYCDMQCATTCGPTLNEIFNRVNQAPDTGKLPGLLTWLCRVKAADLIEELTEAPKAVPKAAKNEWGVKTRPEDQESASLEDILG